MSKFADNLEDIAERTAGYIRVLEEQNRMLREEKVYLLHKAKENVAEIAQLLAENSELKDDACRYRWLRDRFIHSDFSYIAHNGKKFVGLEFGWFPAPDDKTPTREDLDNAIDLEESKMTFNREAGKGSAPRKA